MVRSSITVALAVAVVAAVVGIIAGGGEEGAQPREARMATRAIEEVLKAHTDVLMGFPGVAGTAQSLCDAKPCIRVYVIRKTPDLERLIPNSLEGYPVVIEETGPIKALSKEPR
ncbi:MAG: hypothetical protein ACREXV_06550 [Polaromonas sp.]